MTADDGRWKKICIIQNLASTLYTLQGPENHKDYIYFKATLSTFFS